MIFRNILQGMGSAYIPLISGIAELFARGLGALILGHYFNYLGVCYASPCAWICATVILFIGYKISLYRNYKKLRVE